MIEAITFDFGNTLVPVAAEGLRGVVAITADAVASRLGPFDRDEVLEAWVEERERQFREEVPRFREVDLGERVVRVLARLRGMPAPPPGASWDQAAAARLSGPDEIAWALGVYSRAFVDALPPRPEVAALLARLAGRYRLGILSNWPLAVTIDQYAEAAGWMPYLAAITVSQRVGLIKPHPGIFEAARLSLGGPPAGRILHVGDDWAADVAGGRAAGWRVAYLLARPGDSPLPGSSPDATITPDLVLETLFDLEPALETIGALDRAGDGTP
jgi:FMN phosphatase YigB (HAD superfamily)